MTTITTEKIEELRRLAKAATPGPWVKSKDCKEVGPISKEDDQSYGMILPVAYIHPQAEEQDAAFIAAANPATILALLDVAQRALNANPVVLSVDDAKRAMVEYDAADDRGPTVVALPLADSISPTGELLYTGKAVRAYASQLALPAGPVPAPVDGVHWDQFPAYLIDKCEGATIYEESLQQWLADMLKDPDYIRIAAERACQASAGPVPDGYVLMPRRLTAENGAKGFLSGEFAEKAQHYCTSCDHDEPDDGCEECDGQGSYLVDVPIEWDTIKRIYDKAVETLADPSLAAAQPDNTAAWESGELGRSAEHAKAAPAEIERQVAAAVAQPVADDAILREAAKFAADVLAEIYAKYQLKIGPYASQAQLANVRLGAALRQTPEAVAQPVCQTCGDQGDVYVVKHEGELPSHDLAPCPDCHKAVALPVTVLRALDAMEQAAKVRGYIGFENRVKELRQILQSSGSVAQPVADEREAFEADTLEVCPTATFNKFPNSDCYNLDWIQARWNGWQARAALCPPAAGDKA